MIYEWIEISPFKIWRLERCMSPKQIAEKLGIIVEVYKNWEKGVMPKAKNLKRIKDIMGITLEEIKEWHEQRKVS